MTIKINYQSGLAKLTVIFVVLVILLNILWIAVYHFDKTPLYAIDAMTIGNIIIIMAVRKRVKVAAEILLIMNLTLIFLGFVLIRGLLILR